MLARRRWSLGSVDGSLGCWRGTINLPINGLHGELHPPKRGILCPAGNLLAGDKAGDASVSDQPREASLAGALRKDQGWNRLRTNLLGLSSYLPQIVARVLMRTRCEIGTPSR